MADIEQIIFIKVDKASQQQSLAAIRQYEQVFERTARRVVTLDQVTEAWSQELDKLGRAKGIQALVNEFPRIEAQAGSTTRALDLLLKKLVAIGATDDEIRNVTRELAAANAASNQSGGGGGSPAGGGFVRRLGSELKALPSIAIGSGLPTTDAVGKILQSVGALTSGLGILSGAALGAVAAIGLVSLVFGEVQKAAERAAEKAKAYVTAQLSVTRLIEEGGTTADLEARRAQLEADNRAITSSTSELQTLQLEYQNALAEFVQTPGRLLNDPLGGFRIADEFNARLLEISGGTVRDFTALDTALEENRKQFAANSQEIIAVNERLADGATVLNDLAAAQEVLNEQLREAQRANAQAVNAQVREMVQFGTLLRTGTSSGIRETLTALEDELKIRGDWADELKAQAKLYPEATQAYEENQAAIARLIPEVERYSAVLSSVVERELREANQQDILDTTEELVKAEAELARLRMEETAAAAELASEITRIQREAQAEYDETIQEGVDRQLEILEDAQDREAEIRKKFGKENANAIAERDAKASYLAKQNAEESLDENEKRLSEQLKKEQAALDKRLKAITENANKAITAEQRRFDKEDQLRDRAIQQALVDQTNYQNGLAAITNNGAIRVRNNVTSIFGYMTQIGSAVENYWRQIAQNVIQQVAGMPTSPGTITPPTSPSPFGFGGATADQFVRSIVNDQIDTLYRMAGRAG